MDLTGKDNWLEAQYSVLGSILISPEVAPMVVRSLSEGDFSGTCKTVYKAMRQLFAGEKPIDPVSVIGILGKEYQDFVVQLMEITPTAANIAQYIALCREQAQMRGLKDIAQKITDAKKPEEIRGLFDKASALMVTKAGAQITTMADALREFFDDQQHPPEYLTWAIGALNTILFAEHGDFIVIGGAPSAGKTALALQCAWHFAQKDKCGFFSLETKHKKVFARQVSTLAKIGMGDIKRHTISNDDWTRLCTMSGDISGRNLELIDASEYTVDDIRAITMMQGYKIIFIDYLQLLRSSGANRVEQVTSISLSLHAMAQSLGVTVIALSQLSRTPKEQRGKLPDMSSLRESGQIEQDADIIMLLSLKDQNNRDGQRILQIAKNKEGTRPDMVLDFDGATQTFTKAKGDGSTLGKYIADGKKARRSKEPEVYQQMEMLPDNTPVPF